MPPEVSLPTVTPAAPPRTVLSRIITFSVGRFTRNPSASRPAFRQMASSLQSAVIASFVIWERHIDHPMLPLRFFSKRRYSVAIAALGLVLFALLGMFFLMTQYLQFALGYSPLEAGVRIAPVALVLLVIAPFSVVAARRVGTKYVVGTGLLLIALSLGLLSRT